MAWPMSLDPLFRCLVFKIDVSLTMGLTGCYQTKGFFLHLLKEKVTKW